MLFCFTNNLELGRAKDETNDGLRTNNYFFKRKTITDLVLLLREFRCKEPFPAPPQRKVAAEAEKLPVEVPGAPRVHTPLQLKL